MNLREALKITGGLSNTKAMPEKSFNLSPLLCPTGAVLSEIEGTSCRICYGKKGHYPFGNVQRAMERRQKGLAHPFWVDAMVKLLEEEVQLWFRWFDCGDVQSVANYRDILNVARRTPHIRHWLPTQERSVVKHSGTEAIPSNMTVRISAVKVDGSVDKGWPWTSSVTADKSKATCPKHRNDGCCPNWCRGCWDRKVDTVAYLKH